MPRVDVVVECPVFDSFRVQQVGGMFDVPVTEKAKATFSAELPDVSEEWNIGLIVGPSGSGKSSIAREAFGTSLYAGESWAADKAVIDCFGERNIKEITHIMTAVGFSSPPSWVKPYAVLSNGEKFRCDLARALMTENPLIVFDEFTSVVDRTIAKIGSAAVAKAIRSGKIKRRFVAVSCHYDIADWLEPDWVLDMATQNLARGRLQRPTIKLEIFRCGYEAWKLFSRHHYLNASLNRSAQCYLGTWEGEPVSMVAILPLVGRKSRDRISRIVTLPDFQGIGFGRAMLEAVAQHRISMGRRVNITTSHPAMIAAMKKSNDLPCIGVAKSGHGTQGGFYNGRLSGGKTNSFGRCVASFEYRPAG